MRWIEVYVKLFGDCWDSSNCFLDFGCFKLVSTGGLQKNSDGDKLNHSFETPSTHILI